MLVPPAPQTGTDQLLLDIADYVIGYELQSPEALQTARYALLDSVGAFGLHLARAACVLAGR
jgi:2-methylcitrate dehydratase